MARMHYIPEWAKQAGKSQADLVRATDVDKSNVSRWFKGVIPDGKHLIAVAEAVEAPEPAALFVHPAEYRILQEIRTLAQRAEPAA
jgi:transcriptional regulator with XRE-family HTH domain